MSKYAKFSLFCLASIIVLALLGLIVWVVSDNWRTADGYPIIHDGDSIAIILCFCCTLPVIVWIIGTTSYNRLVSLKQNVEQQGCEINVQMQRRQDLVYNLMNTVKGYSMHESETFENVTRARSGLNNALQLEQDSQQKINNNQDLVNHAIRGYIYAVSEAYPQLQADGQFLRLQSSLEDTENRIAAARSDYVKKIADYNVHIIRFPGNLWSSVFGFSEIQQYQTPYNISNTPNIIFQ